MKKRFISLFLAVVSVFSLAAPAFAEEDIGGDAPEPLGELEETSAPEATEAPKPEAPVVFTVTFKLTVDGAAREDIKKTFTAGETVVPPEEIKSLEQAGYELTWYLDQELTKPVDMEKTPVSVAGDMTLYCAAVLPVPAEPEPTATAEPEPTATAEPEPTATAEPEPTATAEPEPTEEPEETEEPMTVAAGDTVAVTADAISEKGAARAIQDALNAAAEAGTASAPCKVTVPKGTYTLNYGISIGSNTILDLSAGATLVRGDGSFNLVYVGLKDDRNPNDSTSKGATGYAFKNVTIKGGTLNGGGYSTTVLKIGHAANVTVSGVKVRNVANGHLVEVAGVNGLTFSGCAFSDQTLSASAGTRTFEAIQLDVLNGEHISGYRAEPLMTQNVTISGCTFSNVPRGVGGHTSVLNCPITGVTVSGCTFSGIKSAAIFAFSWVGCSFTYNTITNAARGIVINTANADGSGAYRPSALAAEGGVSSSYSDGFIAPAADQRIVIDNNTITLGSSKDPYSGADLTGIVVSGQVVSSGSIPHENYYVSGVKVTNNTITTSDHGIRITDTRNAQVSGNNLSFSAGDSESCGILVTESCSGITVSGNTIPNVGGSGVFASDSKVSVTGNTISGSGSNNVSLTGCTASTVADNELTGGKTAGIRIADSSGVQVTGNKITKPGTQGISSEASTFTASDNTIDTPAAHGVTASGGTPTLENNTIISPAKNGIYVEAGSKLTATDNTVTNAGSSGIFGNGSTVTASKNTITGSGSNSIHLDKCTGSKLSGNTITGPKTAGIRIVNSSGVQVTGNEITKPGTQGISSEASTFTASDNEIDTPAAHGVTASGGAPTLENNTIISPAKNGIYVEAGSKLTATDNTVTNAGSSGIFGNGSTVTASKNTITGSGSNSIHLDKCTGSKLSGNTITGSKAAGIRIVNGSVATVNGTNKITNPATHGISVQNSNATISNNTISGSGDYGIYLEGATFAVSGNTIKGSAGGGDIRVKDSAAKKASGSLTGNDLYGKGISNGSAGKVTESGNTIMLATPKVPSVTVTPGSVKITWDKVTGAVNYRIFYKVSGGSWKKLADTTSRSYTWKEAEGGKTYAFTIRCITADGKTYTSDYNKTGKSAKVPNLATPVISAVSNTADGVKITWGKVEGARNYRVYYKTGSGGWTKAGETTSRTFTWTKAKTGVKYSFTVRCITPGATGYTSAYNKTGKAITYYAAPKITKLENAATGVKITWSKTGAAKYRVYYRLGSGDWKLAGDTSSTTLTWTKGTSGAKYAFTVRCMDKAGNFVSAYDTTGKTITYVAAPKVKLTNTANGLKVTWNKVTGAARYAVYYKVKGDKSWTKIGTTAATSYTFKKAVSGKSYSFAVRCTNAKKANISAYQATAYSAYVATPKAPTVKQTAGGVTISWNKVTGATKYRLYYKTGSGGWHTLVSSTAKTSYTWTKAKSGVKYTFTVRAYKGSAASAYDAAGRSITLK